MNNAAINMCVPLFVWTHSSISFGYIPKSEIARSYDIHRLREMRMLKLVYCEIYLLILTHVL